MAHPAPLQIVQHDGEVWHQGRRKNRAMRPDRTVRDTHPEPDGLAAEIIAPLEAGRHSVRAVLGALEHVARCVDSLKCCSVCAYASKHANMLLMRRSMRSERLGAAPLLPARVLRHAVHAKAERRQRAHGSGTSPALVASRLTRRGLWRESTGKQGALPSP
jgi:hypothetical protein